MGSVFHGIDPNVALSLQHMHHFGIFVETGTYNARTTLWAAQTFKLVFSVEKHRPFFDEAVDKLKSFSNVELFNGDGAAILPTILDRLNHPALFWLDSHWSSDLGYPKEPIVCPVLQEIAAIREDGGPHPIMVDDARLFGVEQGWPSLKEVKEALSYDGRNVVVLNDILVSML